MKAMNSTTRRLRSCAVAAVCSCLTIHVGAAQQFSEGKYDPGTAEPEGLQASTAASAGQIAEDHESTSQAHSRSQTAEGQLSAETAEFDGTRLGRQSAADTAQSRTAGALPSVRSAIQDWSLPVSRISQQGQLSAVSQVPQARATAAEASDSSINPAAFSSKPVTR